MLIQISMLDPHLIEAYLTTDYTVFEPFFILRIGQNSLELDDLLAIHRVSEWAYITAYNPASKLLSEEENENRHQRLLEEAGSYVTFEGEGVSADPAWKSEKSLLILGISKDDACILGSKFGQNAIVFGKTGQNAELILFELLP